MWRHLFKSSPGYVSRLNSSNRTFSFSDDFVATQGPFEALSCGLLRSANMDRHRGSFCGIVLTALVFSPEDRGIGDTLFDHRSVMDTWGTVNMMQIIGRSSWIGISGAMVTRIKGLTYRSFCAWGASNPDYIIRQSCEHSMLTGLRLEWSAARHDCASTWIRLPFTHPKYVVEPVEQESCLSWNLAAPAVSLFAGLVVRFCVERAEFWMLGGGYCIGGVTGRLVASDGLLSVSYRS